jgi:hypothetical protein
MLQETVRREGVNMPDLAKDIIEEFMQTALHYARHYAVHFANIWWLLVIVAIVVFVLVVQANAHDPARPDLDDWYRSLQSSSVHCCDKSEAKQLDGSDWDMKDGHYRVRVDGNWINVLDSALVKGPNLVGPALVWVRYYNPMGGKKTALVRCFMPGTMT